MFVYSAYSQKEYQQACDIEYNLRDASKIYGITYEEPIYVQVDGNGKPASAEDFCYEIEKMKVEADVKV